MPFKAVQKTVADAHADAVSYPVFCTPLRVYTGHVQRKPVRLRPAPQMATGATQRAACVTAGILVGLHHDVVAEDDIGFVIIEHRARLQLLYRWTCERRQRPTGQRAGGKKDAQHVRHTPKRTASRRALVRPRATQVTLQQSRISSRSELLPHPCSTGEDVRTTLRDGALAGHHARRGM